MCHTCVIRSGLLIVLVSAGGLCFSTHVDGQPECCLGDYARQSNEGVDCYGNTAADTCRAQMQTVQAKSTTGLDHGTTHIVSLAHALDNELKVFSPKALKTAVMVPRDVSQSPDLALLLVMASIATQNVKVIISAEKKDGKMVAWEPPLVDGLRESSVQIPGLFRGQKIDYRIEPELSDKRLRAERSTTQLHVLLILSGPVTMKYGFTVKDECGRDQTFVLECDKHYKWPPNEAR